MILSILKSYFSVLLCIGMGSIVIFMTGLYFIFRKTIAIATREKPIAESEANQPFQHLSAIAGDDIITTQLDLARAYLETGRKQLAKEILEYVMQQGNNKQQQEAQQLMNYR